LAPHQNLHHRRNLFLHNKNNKFNTNQLPHKIKPQKYTPHHPNYKNNFQIIETK
jgi:hypothetical protein